MKKEALRLRAEALLAVSESQDIDTTSVQELVHELMVHQIELEMQNDELQRTRCLALEARKSYQLLFESAPCGYVVLDQSGIVLDANNAAEEILNTTLQRLLKRPIVVYIDGMDHVLLFQELEKAFAEESIRSAEFRIRNKGESPKTVSTLLRAIVDCDGTKKCLCAMEDTTALREKDKALAIAEKARQKVDTLEDMNDWLRHVDKMKSDFLSSVSHELRTPLTSIMGFAKIIRRDFKRQYVDAHPSGSFLRDKKETILDNLDIIAKEGLRLKGLIDDLLDLERIESGHMAWHDAPTNLSLLVADIIRSLHGLFFKKTGIEVSFQAQAGLPAVNVDPKRLEQVLVNLLTNAFKYTDSGHIMIRMCSPDRKSLLIQVEDTGYGIDQDYLLKVFDKFYQGNRLQQAEDNGTGLGLPISKRIIEHYNGIIWAESTPAKGTIVSIELPEEALSVDMPAQDEKNDE